MFNLIPRHSITDFSIGKSRNDNLVLSNNIEHGFTI